MDGNEAQEDLKRDERYVRKAASFLIRFQTLWFFSDYEAEPEAHTTHLKKYFSASSLFVFGLYLQRYSVRQIQISLIPLWLLRLFPYQPQLHVLL